MRRSLWQMLDAEVIGSKEKGRMSLNMSISPLIVNQAESGLSSYKNNNLMDIFRPVAVVCLVYKYINMKMKKWCRSEQALHGSLLFFTQTGQVCRPQRVNGAA